jgi:hypothetical protein
VLTGSPSRGDAGRERLVLRTGLRTVECQQQTPTCSDRADVRWDRKECAVLREPHYLALRPIGEQFGPPPGNLILITLLILLLVVAVRKESDRSLRFMKKQNEISKPASTSAAH